MTNVEIPDEGSDEFFECLLRALVGIQPKSYPTDQRWYFAMRAASRIIELKKAKQQQGFGCIEVEKLADELAQLLWMTAGADKVP